MKVLGLTQDSWTFAVTDQPIIKHKTAATGLGLITMGGVEPINTRENTNIMGWGEIDGPAWVWGGLRIPKTKE